MNTAVPDELGLTHQQLDRYAEDFGACKSESLESFAAQLRQQQEKA